MEGRGEGDGDGYERVPVKLPGWSQPGVLGLQAWMEAMRRAEMVMRVVYMVAMD